MNRFKKLTILSIILSIFFIGCEYLIQMQIKIQEDILSLISENTKTTEPINVKIRFQMSSKEQCDKQKDNLTTIMSKYYKEVKQSECKSVEMNTFLDLVAVTTIHSVHVNVPKEEIYMIGLILEKRGKSVDVLMRLDKEKFAALNADIKKQYMQDLKLDDVKLSIQVSNDTTSKQDLRVFHAFVNTEPIPSFGDYSIKPNETLSIQISDVTKHYINNNGFRRIFEIRNIGQTSTEKTDSPKNSTKEPSKIQQNKNLSDDDSIIIE